MKESASTDSVLGGTMKKQLICGLLILTAGVCAFAGDAAAFVDVGISADGTTYVFGEYGKTDRTFQAYAELYAIDIAKNAFVPNAVFKTAPSLATASKSGKAVYEELFSRADWALKKYGCKPAAPNNLLYQREEGSAAVREITFQDFEGSTVEQPVFCHITLVPNSEGKGASVRSSFFIVLEKQDSNGKVLSRNVIGSPDIKRKGVIGYAINRIFSTADGRNIVFVIEKTLEDSTGTSVRYMVETIRL